MIEPKVLVFIKQCRARIWFQCPRSSRQLKYHTLISCEGKKDFASRKRPPFSAPAPQCRSLPLIVGRTRVRCGDMSHDDRHECRHESLWQYDTRRWGYPRSFLEHSEIATNSQIIMEKVNFPQMSLIRWWSISQLRFNPPFRLQILPLWLTVSTFSDLSCCLAHFAYLEGGETVLEWLSWYVQVKN